ncbi:2966_t:CDS:10 [Rhizophagus irregularis]|nr:2966_t:CDS:10 [Rhizophagus irregularis]
MTDYTDFDNDDEFLYGGIDEQTVEPQTAIEAVLNADGYSKNNIKEVVVEDDDFFDMYGGGTNHDISNANEASKDIKHVEVDSIRPGQDHDIYYPPIIEDFEENYNIHDDQKTQSTYDVHDKQDVHNTQNIPDIESTQASQDIQEMQEDQDIDPLELSAENGNLDDIEIIMDAPPKPTDNAASPTSISNLGRDMSIEGGQASSSRTPGVDINAIGTIDGTSIYDVDLDSFEDKPWRKPGADITDYFNYGFNEYTWKAYCAKQKQMREDQHQRKKIHAKLNNLPPELQSISQPQPGGQDHSRFQQQRGRDFKHVGRRGRDQDDSVIQVVSSEREAALEELEPIPPPSMDQNEEFNMEGGGGYPQNFSGYRNPMGMGMFPPPEMGGPMGPPPFFADMPPTGPMGFDPSYRGQPMRNMMRPGGMPGGIPGMPGMPGITRGMPPNMQGGMPGGMPGGVPGMPRGMPGIPGGMPGGMVGRGRGMPMDERPFYSMEEPTWEMENRNSPSFRPGHGGFQGRPPTGPMLGPGGNRSDYHEWEHSPPPDAPFAHRIRPFRPPTGPATHTSSVNSPSSDRGDEERGGDRSASGSVERSHGYTRREDERWDGSRKRTTGETPRDDDEFRAKRRH